MAVIVSTAAPCLIRSTTLVNTPAPIQIDIPRTSPSTSPSSSSISLPHNDIDFTTPRSIAHSLDIVAVAAATIPTLPLDPTSNTEYRLTSKRKALDSQDDDDDDDDDDVPQGHPSKRWKADLPADPLILCTEYINTPTASQTTSDPDVISNTIDQVLAAICTSSADLQTPTPSSQPIQLPTSSRPPPLQPTDIPPPSYLEPDLLPTTSPLTDSYPTDEDEDVDIEDDFDPCVLPRYVRPPTRPPTPTCNRVLEMPIWKLACRARVDHISNVYGIQAIRDSVRQNVETYPPLPYPFPKPSLSSCISEPEQATTEEETASSGSSTLAPPLALQDVGILPAAERNTSTSASPVPSSTSVNATPNTNIMPSSHQQHTDVQASSGLGLGLGLSKGLQLEICTPSDFTTPGTGGVANCSSTRTLTPFGSDSSPGTVSRTGEEGENGILRVRCEDANVETIINSTTSSSVPPVASVAGASVIVGGSTSSRTMYSGCEDEDEKMIDRMGYSSSSSLMDTTYDGSEEWSSDTESDCDLDLEDEGNEEEMIEAISPHESVLDIPPVLSPPNSGLPPTCLAPLFSGGGNNAGNGGLVQEYFAPTEMIGSTSGLTTANSHLHYQSGSAAGSSSSSLSSTPSSSSSQSGVFAFSVSYGNTDGVLGPINPALSLLPLPKLSSIPAYPLRDVYPDMEFRGTPRVVSPLARGFLRRRS